MSLPHRNCRYRVAEGVKKVAVVVGGARGFRWIGVARSRTFCRIRVLLPSGSTWKPPRCRRSRLLCKRSVPAAWKVVSGCERLPPIRCKRPSDIGTAAVEIEARSRPIGAPVKPMLLDSGVLTRGICATLKHMVSSAPRSQRHTCFCSSRIPMIQISDYFARISSHFRCSAECYVAGLIYIHRVMELHPDILFSAFSCHRLTLAAMVAAAKFHDDRCYSNAFYAKAGGVTLQELNAFELRIMQLLGWKLHVTGEEYDVYAKMIAARGPSMIAQ